MERNLKAKKAEPGLVTSGPASFLSLDILFPYVPEGWGRVLSHLRSKKRR